MTAILDVFNRANHVMITSFTEDYEKFEETLDAEFYNLRKFLETGDVSYLKKEIEKHKEIDTSKKDNQAKENVEPNTSILPKRTTRQRNATQIDTSFANIPQIIIKKEKLSVYSKKSVSVASSSSTIDVTKNDAPEEMPAPTKMPPKKKKIKEEPEEPVKRTRARTKTRKLYDQEAQPEIDKGKTSDVIVQNTTITMIDITEEKGSDNEKKKTKPSGKATYDQPTSVAETTRSTRTKTRQQQKLVEKEPEPEIIETEAKMSPSASSVEKDDNVQTDYEDAMSSLDSAEVPELPVENGPILNATVVIEKSKSIKPVEDKNEDNPEEKTNNWNTPPRTKSKKEQIKEIFSPYEKTSLKKKVEAFEKFGSATKQNNRGSKIPIKEDTNSEPTKSKLYTPFSNKFLPKTCSTSKPNRFTPQKTSMHNESGLSMKSLSTLKASQAEFREREKRRQDKEREAQIKKEALLQAQAENKRRKREEKQLKAQQQRDIIQKEKEKLLELQKLKEEKYKQALAEKEEKLQRSKEEAEKKRLMAKNKAKLAKENESQEEQVSDKDEKRKTKRTHPQTVPVYMLTKAPLLPTDDCYDSDEEQHQKYVKPKWCRDEYSKRQLYAQLVAGEKIKNTLFCCQTHSPDLVDIFEVIDPKKLKRTSSALWKKPPRYTVFSMTSDIHFSEDSEDDI